MGVSTMLRRRNTFSHVLLREGVSSPHDALHVVNHRHLTRVRACAYVQHVRRGVLFPRELHGSEGYASTCCHDDGCPGNRGRRSSNSKHERHPASRNSKARCIARRYQGQLLRVCNPEHAAPLTSSSHREILHRRARCCSLGALCSGEGIRIQSRSDQLVFWCCRTVPIPWTSSVFLLDADA
jgi:hypothetical protein